MTPNIYTGLSFCSLSGFMRIRLRGTQIIVERIILSMMTGDLFFRKGGNPGGQNHPPECQPGRRRSFFHRPWWAWVDDSRRVNCCQSLSPEGFLKLDFRTAFSGREILLPAGEVVEVADELFLHFLARHGGGNQIA